MNKFKPGDRLRIISSRSMRFNAKGVCVSDPWEIAGTTFIVFHATETKFDTPIVITNEWGRPVEIMESDCDLDLGSLTQEQVCREILAQAIEEGIVTFNRDHFGSTKTVRELTSGDCCGMANLLRNYLRSIHFPADIS